jgi:lipid II:glycine glycyltransferase (peptidoglycan interpeptide bridge formation enzyme)
MAYEQSDRFYIHTLDLHEDLDAIFGKLHKSCIQRKIHRAERENLGYEEGRSRALLERFYHLVVLTRRRHQLPPQPFRWYRNLSEYMGESLTIRIVSKEGRPVAGLLTLAHGNTLVYKYGGSDAQFHNLGGMPLLFWKTIQSAKASGVVSFDLGRSEPDNEGLVSFKGHLGAVGSEIAYYRYPTKASQTAVRRLGIRAAKYVFARLPDVVRVPAGALLYKHMG